VSSVTSEQGQSVPAGSAPPGPGPGRLAGWAGGLVAALYVVAACTVTWRLWGDPAQRMVAGNPGDNALFAWFMRYSATAVSHGHFPALVTTALNAPQGINLMWNTSELLPGILLAPLTLLAGPQASLTVLLTAGFAGSAASLYWVLRRWGASVLAAGLGGAVYGFSPAMTAASEGHFQLQFMVLPPLIVHLVLRIVTGRGSALRAGLWLGLLTAAQVFIGEELLVDTAVAVVIMLAVLALGQPRAAVRVVRARAGPIAAGLGTAIAAAAVTSGYPLWVQLKGPLAEHGSPWAVSTFHSYLSGFVTPSASLLFHTSASAASAARYPEPQPEYLAYLGWPLLIAAAIAAAVCWREARIRLAAVTFALLELLSLGDAPVRIGGFRCPAALLPWHWLAGSPLLGDVLPDRFSLLADGAVAALLAFALDRARLRRPAGRPGRVTSWASAAVVAAAVLPLVPRPLAAASIPPAPAGWQTAFARLRLPAGAHVLVIPDLRYGMRWQSETGVPDSIVGGGDFVIPGPGGLATSYVYERLRAASYLTSLWQGQPEGQPPSQAELGQDLRYWQAAAVVTVTGPGSLLARFLTARLGAPAVHAGDVLAWRVPRPGLTSAR
jgi:hypothetical protein